jgi:hypothetical protein
VPTLERGSKLPPLRSASELCLPLACAFQSIQIGLAHVELFHYVLAYSGGFGGIGLATEVAIETQSPWRELLAIPEERTRATLCCFVSSQQDNRQQEALVRPRVFEFNELRVSKTLRFN